MAEMHERLIGVTCPGWETSLVAGGAIEGDMEVDLGGGARTRSGRESAGSQGGRYEVDLVDLLSSGGWKKGLIRSRADNVARMEENYPGSFRFPTKELTTASNSSALMKKAR
jgi:hypothetical protein